MATVGTGGILDVESYLMTRVGLHHKVGMHAMAFEARSILALLDSNQLDDFYSYIAENACFRFGSQEAVVGKRQIIACIEGFLSTVVSMRHDVHREMVSNSMVVIVGDVTYHMTNGRQATIPFCDTWKLSPDHRIVEYRVYSDPTPLM
jgi:limonene-1,2-epoxide hydrolase